MVPGMNASGLRRDKLMIQKNLSRFDQIFRISIGVLLVYIGFIDNTQIGDTCLAGAMGVFGLVNLCAGTIAYCPLYRLAGINTRSSS